MASRPDGNVDQAAVDTKMNTASRRPVLVSLVTYNDESFLARCLEAVQRQTIEVRVKLFDNDSHDGTREIARSYGIQVHESTENRGYSFGHKHHLLG